MLRSTHHPNIVHGVCCVEDKLQIIYPYLGGGDLVPLEDDNLSVRVSGDRGRTGRVLSPDDSFLPRFARQLILAVAHMHAKGIIHFDLKPENFVIAGPDRHFIRPFKSTDVLAYHLVLIDFGLAEAEASLPDECIKAGTEVTMAPEQVLCNHHAGFGTDWWGVGAALYRVRVFWEPSIDEPTRDKILSSRDPQWGHVSLPMQPFFSPDFSDLLGLMLTPKPADRDFDKHLDNLLKHPFIRRGEPPQLIA